MCGCLLLGIVISFHNISTDVTIRIAFCVDEARGADIIVFDKSDENMYREYTNIHVWLKN